MKKAYLVYMDDGRDAFRVNVPAENKKAAADYVNGNGEIIAIKENPYCNADSVISLDKIVEALRRAQFGQMEIDLISRALGDCEFIG